MSYSGFDIMGTSGWGNQSRSSAPFKLPDLSQSIQQTQA